MGKITFALIVFGIVGNIFAMKLSDWEKLVVKVKSFPCLTQYPVYEGSGVFLGNGEIITSEHVLMPKGNKDICYEVSNNFVDIQKVKLLKNDFSSGLAKLALINKLDTPQVKIETNLNSSKEIWALGFPKGSSRIQILESGKIRSLNGTRALIPSIKEMIEVSNIPVEYGMSGGVLISKNNHGYAYAGTLTHQYLKRVAGKETEVMSTSSENNLTSNDLAIGIKPKDVLSWSQSGENKSLLWERALNPNIRGSQGVMKYGPFSFEKKLIDSSIFRMGGADGVGIGGENDNDEKDGLIGIEIRLNDDALENFNEFDLKSPILKNWYQWLLRGETLTIVQLSNKNKSESITSFDQLVTLWERDGYRPLVIRGEISNLDSKMNEIFSLTRKMRETLVSLKNKVNSRNTAYWIDFYLNRVLMIENNLGGIEKLKVFEQQFAQDFWDSIYIDFFDEALILEGQVVELKSAFRKL